MRPDEREALRRLYLEAALRQQEEMRRRVEALEAAVAEAERRLSSL